MAGSFCLIEFSIIIDQKTGKLKDRVVTFLLQIGKDLSIFSFLSFIIKEILIDKSGKST